MILGFEISFVNKYCSVLCLVLLSMVLNWENWEGLRKDFITPISLTELTIIALQYLSARFGWRYIVERRVSTTHWNYVRKFFPGPSVTQERWYFKVCSFSDIVWIIDCLHMQYGYSYEFSDWSAIECLFLARLRSRDLRAQNSFSD